MPTAPSPLTAAANPLLADTQLPRFADIRPEHIEPAIRQLLGEGRKRLALSEGMRTLRIDGISKLKRGLTTAEEVLKETAADNV